MTPPAASGAGFFQSAESVSLLRDYDATRPPRHVAVIMDGNGRWATNRGLPRLAGHRAGAKAVREVIAAALELGVEFLTIYSFSSENWSRPRDEVSGLMDLFVEILERELANLQKMDVRVRVIGHREGLPPSTAAAFAATEKATEGNVSLNLLVALNYGGRAELSDAVRTIATKVESGALSSGDVDEELVASCLYTADIPDPDLLVRTSGEMRVSNFLLWQIAYSEIYVTGTLWPDFDRTEFLRAVVDFQQRSRRFGGRS
ncbi:MAG: isoprenyl transferase [Coriobacteriia bacterium]|nr:isoprenyl transferase [Coriobacteriia bacterium]